MSGERGSGSGVSGGCDLLSWLPWLFSRKSSLGAESWSCCSTSQSVCDELSEQGSAGMSMSSGCFGCVGCVLAVWLFWLVIRVLVGCVNHMMTRKLI